MPEAVGSAATLLQDQSLSKFESQQTVAYMKTEKSALEMHGKGFCATRAHMTLNVIQFHASHVNFEPHN